MFAGEAKAVLDHLPTMDAGTFFEVQSAGNVAAQLEDMEAEEVAGDLQCNASYFVSKENHDQ